MEKENKIDDLKTRHEHFMGIAYKLAVKSFEEGEIPIGAVIVKKNIVIAKGRNKRNKTKNALDHAEMIAIKKACKVNGDWRLKNCDIYVTLMPCPMCAGAIVNARIENVIYGVASENQNLFSQIMLQNGLNHKTNIVGGVLGEKCTKLLQSFFELKRQK